LRITPSTPGKNDLRVQQLHFANQVDVSLWNGVHQADPHATPYQAPGWMAGICSAGKFHDATRCYHFGDTKVVLPLAEARSLPGLRTVRSMPFGFGAGGPISNEPLTTGMWQEILADLSKHRASALSIRSNPALDLGSLGQLPTGWSMRKRSAHPLFGIGRRENLESIRQSQARQHSQGP
jgi:hypothetical protein